MDPLFALDKVIPYSYIKNPGEIINYLADALAGHFALQNVPGCSGASI